MKAETTRVKEFWSASPNMWRAETWVHWTQHTRVQERLNLLTSGEVNRNRFEHFMFNHLAQMPVKCALTLGCGHGDLERGLSKYDFALRHDGIDIAEGAIAEARRQARDAGLINLHYTIGDLNSLVLPRYQYDVVFGIGSFHHVENLERLLIQVSQTLKPNGYLVLDEYIGPNQFQWPDEQLDIINDHLLSIPERLRMSLTETPFLKGPVKRDTIEEMNAIDPSEAIRSEDIVHAVSFFFDVVEIKGCGGSLLHLLLEHIAGNFREDDPESMQCLYSLFDSEDQLIDSGKLKHDFALIIARKKTTWRTWLRYCAHQVSSMLAKR